MFRPALRAVVQQQRSIVTSARNWEQHGVSLLKKEAKARGLPASGSKAALILRLKDHEKLGASASHDLSTPSGARHTSNVAGSTHTVEEVAIAPGIVVDQAVDLNKLSSDAFTNISLPDISQGDPEPPIQIPFAPDFWESSRSAPKPAAEEPVLPKLALVAGAETHPGGGPSHNLLDGSVLDGSAASTEPPQTSPSSQSSTKPGQGGLFDDIAEDIGIPYPKELKNAFSKLFR